MTWLRIDDGFFEHDKIENLSDKAFRLHVGGLCFSARLLTDGRISESNLRKIAASMRMGSCKRYVDELVAARLWSSHPRGGWRIKDYLEYNPSSVQVKEQRQRNAERQARHRDIHKVIPRSNALRNGVSNDAPSRTPYKNRTTQDLSSKDVTSKEDAAIVLELVREVSDSFGAAS